MIKIIIADDHEIVRKGLIQILTSEPDIIVAGEAGDGREALELIRRETCDVLVLDISMPHKTGMDVLQEVKRERSKLPVLILSTHAEEEYAMRVLKAGASGFLSKQTAPRDLIAAIKKVAGGGRYVSESLAESLAFLVGKTTDVLPHETLSEREFQVMILIAQGKPLKKIAYELSLSEKTVSTYRTRILDKMSVSKNIELARYAWLHGLIE